VGARAARHRADLDLVAVQVRRRLKDEGTDAHPKLEDDAAWT
jgi:hypothetical protein